MLVQMLWVRGLIFTVLVPTVVGIFLPSVVDPRVQRHGGIWDAGWLVVAAGDAVLAFLPDPIPGRRRDARHLFHTSSAASNRRGARTLGVGRSVPFLPQSHVRGSAAGCVRPGSALRIASDCGLRSEE